MSKIKLTQVSNLPKRNSSRQIIPTEKQLIVYQSLVLILRPYSKVMRIPMGAFSKFIVDTPTQFELWIPHPERKNVAPAPGVLFTAVAIRQEVVGLYFFPLLICPELREKIPGSQLLKLLNGTSVFHITEINESLLDDIKRLLDVGVKFYKEIGWI